MASASKMSGVFSPCNNRCPEVCDSVKKLKGTNPPNELHNSNAFKRVSATAFPVVLGVTGVGVAAVLVVVAAAVVVVVTVVVGTVGISMH